MHMLAIGPIGVRLYARVLTAPAVCASELAEHLVDEINCYLPRATSDELALLYPLACELPDWLVQHYDLVADLSVRRAILDDLNRLLGQSRAALKGARF
ncbi:hypothetical protein ACTSKR_15220 [Chitinibacteraceae bacterium HSL-7]